MKQVIQLGKDNIKHILEDIVDKFTNISISSDNDSIVLSKDNRIHKYSIEYDDKYGYYKLYKVYKSDKKYIGYMLDSSDLVVTINGIIRKWDS